MPAGRCSSSKHLRAVAAGLAMVLLSACSGQTPSLLDGAAGSPVKIASRARQPASAAAAIVPAGGGSPEVQSEAADSLDVPHDLAWCRYLDARANAKNALLLSPTVSASIDDEQKAGAKISYDFVDIARANLEKRSARASCARYYAQDRITRMLYMTPQSLTYAGNLEKANYLASMRGDLNAIARRVNQHVQNGEMTAQLAAGITQYIETIESLEFQARAEAHRREAVKFFAEGSMTGLDRQLTEAERALQDVDRVSRNLEAVSVNLSAGVNRDMREDDEFFDDDSAYAKLTVSYRLGAVNPSRSYYEREAERARLDALNEEGQGSLWYTREMAAAIGRARDGLMVQRQNVIAAIAEARQNSQKYSEGYEIELYQSVYRAKVDVIKLTADLRGIDGTLADIAKVERSLRFQ